MNDATYVLNMKSSIKPDSTSIVNNFFNTYSRNISDEVCFVYLNFIGKTEEIKHEVTHYNNGHEGVIGGMKFNSRDMSKIVEGSIKCLEFLTKYHVKS